MTGDEALALVTESVFTRTGKELTDLQSEIVLGVWQRQSYREIADEYRCTEQHVSEVASQLWKLLSEVWGTKVTKKNFRQAAERQCQSQQSIRFSNAQDAVEQSVKQSSLDPNFLGREDAIAALKNLVNQGKKIILLHGKGGVGKTTLASEFFKSQGFQPILELWMAKETQYITSVEGIIQQWLRQHFNEEPGQELGVSLERLRQQLRNSKQKVGILIDNLEPALEKGKFIKSQRGYVELLRVLADPSVQSFTIITSRECLREAVVEVEEYRLEGLDEGVWQEVFHNCNIPTETPALRAMQQAYGGNAKAMNILTKAIQKDFAGDIEEYWRINKGNLLIERELEDLVTSQFNRLQQLDVNAYQLLYRLGCYRYQDVPTVPIQGLFSLLWDVPEHQHQRVVKSLVDTSLLDCRNREYLLHPVIRAEAIKRLRESEEWETANRKAAEYWTESVKTVETVQEAVKAFEAYYHYLAINDFQQAGYVIELRRDCKWKRKLEGGEPLAFSFYRLGRLQQITSATEWIISNINSEDDFYIACILNKILAGAFWLNGSLYKAIQCYKLSSEQAKQYLKYIRGNNFESQDSFKLRETHRTPLANLLGIGLCQIELWELEEAIKNFNLVKELTENKDLHQYQCNQYTLETYFCLAFLNSTLGFREEAYYFAERVCDEMQTACSAWNTAYSLLFLGKTYSNLNEIEKSSKMYRKAIGFAEENSYMQVKAKALYGLAEIYRQQEDFTTALSHHTESIKLLEKIGAKPDIAEAYYQLALTYQKMGDTEKSQPKFQQAIKLFTEMEAPKQVEKVQRAMENGENH